MVIFCDQFYCYFSIQAYNSYGGFTERSSGFSVLVKFFFAAFIDFLPFCFEGLWGMLKTL